MPWWAACALGGAAYGLLHYLAIQPLPPITNLQQLYHALGDLLLWALASAGQYLLPLLLCAGAVASYKKQRQRAKLVDQATANPAAALLDDITWQEFEQLVGEVFRRSGYQVQETGGGGADGGVDLILRRNGEMFLVQCKQWKAFRVSVEIVREMFGLMAAKGADGGFVVTSGRFTGPAKAFAKGRNLSLIDGTALHTLLHQTKLANQRPPPPVAATPPVPALAPTPAPPARPQAPAAPQRMQQLAHHPAPHSQPQRPPHHYPQHHQPHHPQQAARQPARPPVRQARSSGQEVRCPVCSQSMLLRTASKGPQAGTPFWGCIHYPRCTGTRQHTAAPAPTATPAHPPRGR